MHSRTHLERSNKAIHPIQTTLSCLWDVPREDPHICILFGVVIYILLWFAATASARHGHGVTSDDQMPRSGKHQTVDTYSVTRGRKKLADKDM